MIILRNFDFSHKYFDYLALKEYSEVPEKINGWYKLIDNKLTSVFVLNYEMYFVFGEQKYLVTDSYRVLNKNAGDRQKEFVLFNEQDDVVRFFYSIPDEFTYDPPFDYIDEDDSNWGDFIERIINNPEKKRHFINNLME